jgi:hypothetical protein
MDENNVPAPMFAAIAPNSRKQPAPAAQSQFNLRGRPFPAIMSCRENTSMHRHVVSN